MVIVVVALVILNMIAFNVAVFPHRLVPIPATNIVQIIASAVVPRAIATPQAVAVFVQTPRIRLAAKTVPAKLQPVTRVSARTAVQLAVRLVIVMQPVAEDNVQTILPSLVLETAAVILIRVSITLDALITTITARTTHLAQ